MKYIIYTFYQYYNYKSHASIAYESSIMLFILTLFINLLSILILFNLMQYFPKFEDDQRWKNFLFIIFIFIPMYFITSNIYKKSKLISIDLKVETVRKFKFLTILYLIFTMTLFLYSIYS